MNYDPREISIQARSDRYAEENRRRWRERGLFVVNLIGSPGCGKTTLLEETLKRLELPAAVIEGDVRTEFDTERIRSAGAESVQVETRGACHLNARQVGEAAGELDLEHARILFIENVGNLVCPSSFDLGEDVKAAVISVPEGDEKPAKYPALFVRAGVVIIGKIDLLEHLDYSVERAAGDARKLNSAVEIFQVSAGTGEGLDAWLEYLERQARAALGRGGS